MDADNRNKQRFSGKGVSRCSNSTSSCSSDDRRSSPALTCMEGESMDSGIDSTPCSLSALPPVVGATLVLREVLQGSGSAESLQSTVRPRGGFCSVVSLKMICTGLRTSSFPVHLSRSSSIMATCLCHHCSRENSGILPTNWLDRSSFPTYLHTWTGVMGCTPPQLLKVCVHRHLSVRSISNSTLMK